MEKVFKVRSSSLSLLNEALQKATLNDTVKNFTPVIVEADGKFSSIIKTASEFDPSDFGNTIETEEQSIENKETKEQLLNQAKDALKQTLSNSKELEDILNKIKNLSNDDDYNKWKVNEEGNTATLKSRNSYIFKQNNNLCLSHNGKIELFHSVQELHDWLTENGYPLPGDICIHESVKEAKEEDRNWYDLVKAYKEKQKTEYQPQPSSKTFSDDDYRGIGKAIQKKDYQDFSKAKKVEPIEELPVFNNSEEVDECGGACVGTAALGPAVAYTASPKKKEEEVSLHEAFQEAFDLDEAGFASFIPNDDRVFPGARNAVNAFLTWFKRNEQGIASGEIKLTDDFKDRFEKEIKPVFFRNVSDVMDPIWLDTVRRKVESYGKRLATDSGLKPNTATWEKKSNQIALEMLQNPDKQLCKELSKELNSYISEDHQDGLVNLIPGSPLLKLSKGQSNYELNKDNPEYANYMQRLKWREAGLQSGYDGYWAVPGSVKNFKKIENYILNAETKGNNPYGLTNDEVKTLKRHKVNIDDYSEPELRGILKLFTKKKAESSIFESAKNYPWLNKILGTRLVEDDTPADFATGKPVVDDMNSIANSSNDTATTDTTTDNIDVDIPDDFSSDSDTKKSFGDIDINTNYTPDIDNPDDGEIPLVNTPEYKIIDVLMNDEDDTDIKVKVQNQDTKEIEIKDLSEIDV